MSLASGGMSADDMRAALYEKMQEKGVLDSLKSQLRNYMVCELSKDSKSVSSQKKRLQSPLHQKILSSLIYKHLIDTDCDYTVGVFLPEAGMSKREIMTEGELCEIFKIGKPIDSGDASVSVLHQIVKSSMRTLLRVPHSETTQTEAEPTGFLMDKLTRIDEEFSRKPHGSPKLSIEERLLSYQQRIETEAKAKLDAELERWKRSELDSIRTIERERNQRELMEIRNKLEDEYRKKVVAVSDRERSLADSVKSEFDTVQRETFQQRQQLLQQSEQLRGREAELREQKEQMNRLQRLSEEKVKELEQQVRRREEEIKSRELHLDNTLRTHQERIRLEEQINYDTKYRELKTWETSLKDRSAALDREKKSLLTENERHELITRRQTSEELDQLNRKYCLDIASLEMKVQNLQERIAKVYDYEVIRDSNVSLKKDLEMTKERLDAVMREKGALQQKYEHLVIDGKGRAGAKELLIVKTQIQRERDRALDDKVLLEHRLREMEGKFQGQVSKNRSLLTEFELQTERQKLMNREQSDIRQRLTQSQGTAGTPGRSRAPADLSFYDTSFHKSLPPELSLGAWPAAGDASSNEVSTATEDSIVTETRKRLQSLSNQADNLQSAFKSLTKRPSPSKAAYCESEPARSPSKSVAFAHGPKVSRDVSWAKAETVETTSYLGGHVHGERESKHVQLSPGQGHVDTAFSARERELSQAEQFNRATPNKASPADTTAISSRLPDVRAAVRSEIPVTPSYQIPSMTAAEASRSPTAPSEPLLVTPKRPDHVSSSSSPPEAVEPVSRASMMEDNAEPRRTNQVIEVQEAKKPPTEAANLSLDEAWEKPPAEPVTVGDARTEAPSLDEAWDKPPAEPVTVGDARTEAPSLDDAWKQTRPEPVTPPAMSEKGRQPIPVDRETESKPSLMEENASIDPVMLRYMEMLKNKSNAAESNPDPAQRDDKRDEATGGAYKDFLGDETSISEQISAIKSDHSDVAVDDDFW